MTNAIKIAAVAVAALTLAACGTTESGYSDQGSSGSLQATSAAESACMAAVNRQYGGKYDVRVIRSEYSEANLLVMVDANPVGGMTERWRCLVSNDGKVQDLSLAQGKPAAGPSSSGDLGGSHGSSAPSRGDSAERAGRGDFDANAPVKCAEGAGSAWMQCDAGVAREGGGTATVVVTRPDGRKRFIFFKKGKAVSADLSQADSSQHFHATRQGDMYLIEAGHERYEFVEALVFGG